MILMIDGYNYAKFLYGPEYNRLSALHTKLLHTLSAYARKKRKSVSQMSIVFDGGVSLHPERDNHHGLTVVSAGHGRSADDYLVEACDRFAGHDVVVVTNDRELSRRCKAHGARLYAVADFVLLVRMVMRSPAYEGKEEEVVVRKTSAEANDELDALMMGSDMAMYHDNDDDEPEERTRSGNKKSKKERARERYNKKLG